MCIAGYLRKFSFKYRLYKTLSDLQTQSTVYKKTVDELTFLQTPFLEKIDNTLDGSAAADKETFATNIPPAVVFSTSRTPGLP